MSTKEYLAVGVSAFIGAVAGAALYAYTTPSHQPQAPGPAPQPTVVPQQSQKPEKASPKEKPASKLVELSDEDSKSEEYQTFLKVKKNQVAVMTNLVGQARKVEVVWESKEERMRLLRILRSCLSQLHDHKSKDVQELSWLAPKMKNLELDQNHFLSLFLPIERKHARGLRDDEFIITTTDRSPQTAEKIPLYLILHNLRSSFNVGAIFRTADCIGVTHIYICGYTSPPDKNATLEKTTMGADKIVDWSYHKTIEDVFAILKGNKIPIYALETVEQSKTIFTSNLFPSPGCAVLLGNERFGIEANTLTECDGVISIPCSGVKNSLNVGVAFGVCGYEILRQWKYSDL